MSQRALIVFASAGALALLGLGPAGAAGTAGVHGSVKGIGGSLGGAAATVWAVDGDNGRLVATGTFGKSGAFHLSVPPGVYGILAAVSRPGGLRLGISRFVRVKGGHTKRAPVTLRVQHRPRRAEKRSASLSRTGSSAVVESPVVSIQSIPLTIKGESIDGEPGLNTSIFNDATRRCSVRFVDRSKTFLTARDREERAGRVDGEVLEPDFLVGGSGSSSDGKTISGGLSLSDVDTGEVVAYYPFSGSISDIARFYANAGAAFARVLCTGLGEPLTYGTVHIDGGPGRRGEVPNVVLASTSDTGGSFACRASWCSVPFMSAASSGPSGQPGYLFDPFHLVDVDGCSRAEISTFSDGTPDAAVCHTDSTKTSNVTFHVTTNPLITVRPAGPAKDETPAGIKLGVTGPVGCDLPPEAKSFIRKDKNGYYCETYGYPGFGTFLQVGVPAPKLSSWGSSAPCGPLGTPPRPTDGSPSGECDFTVGKSDVTITPTWVEAIAPGEGGEAAAAGVPYCQRPGPHHGAGNAGIDPCLYGFSTFDYTVARAALGRHLDVFGDVVSAEVGAAARHSDDQIEVRYLPYFPGDLRVEVVVKAKGKVLSKTVRGNVERSFDAPGPAKLAVDLGGGAGKALHKAKRLEVTVTLTGGGSFTDSVTRTVSKTISR